MQLADLRQQARIMAGLARTCCGLQDGAASAAGWPPAWCNFGGQRLECASGNPEGIDGDLPPLLVPDTQDAQPLFTIGHPWVSSPQGALSARIGKIPGCRIRCAEPAWLASFLKGVPNGVELMQGTVMDRYLPFPAQGGRVETGSSLKPLQAFKRA